MLEQILTALFPEQPPSPAIRRAWKTAFLLFPAALVAGFFLLVKNSPPSPVPVATNGGKAIEIARAFLQREGSPAAGWTATSNYATENDLLDFVNAKPERARLWSVAPPISAAVVFRKPASDDSARVYVSVDGKVLGFSMAKVSATAQATAELSDEDARTLAEARLPAGFRFGQPSVERTGSERVYTFRSSGIPDAELKADITVHGSRVTSLQLRAEPADSTRESSDQRLQTALSIAGAIFVCIVAIFSLYRYASRTLQQEVSHRRSLIVALLCGCFCVLLGLNAVVNSNAGTVPIALVLLVFAVTGVMGGALVAAACGSGEGDIREAFPGKLTSLDTLLAGHALSRNVGISVLFGMASASWLTLALALLGIPFRSDQPLGTQHMVAPFLRLGWLMPFVTYPLMSLAFVAAGLLQPLAFLERYAARARRLHLPVLLLCAGLASMLRTHARSTTEFLCASVVFVVALLLPFFLLDLLAALICVTALFSLAGMAAGLAAAPAFAGTSLLLHAGAVAGIVVFGIVCVRRGRTFTEEQVRPLYARHIAERKALEAEVSAAREAQLRLLPEGAPDFAGLHISAACLPAETVGGDFYDFFPLGDGRLGVFIAEGNNRGLAAALTIALAKGYLMQCVERFHEPVEILTRLEAALASIFDRGSPSDPGGASSALTEFAFAAIDTARGEIRYARTSAYPKVVVISANSRPVSERMVQVKGRRSPIAEGQAQLSPGDHIVLFTDGIGRRLAGGNRKPEDTAAALVSQSLARMSAATPNPADDVRDWFFAATEASVEPDDLTLVVIRLHTLVQFEGTAALGVVA